MLQHLFLHRHGKISMSDASQETYAHRNNSGLFAGLFYYPDQRTNDEKSQ